MPRKVLRKTGSAEEEAGSVEEGRDRKCRGRKRQVLRKTGSAEEEAGSVEEGRDRTC